MAHPVLQLDLLGLHNKELRAKDQRTSQNIKDAEQEAAASGNGHAESGNVDTKTEDRDDESLPNLEDSDAVFGFQEYTARKKEADVESSVDAAIAEGAECRICLEKGFRRR